MTYKEKLKAEIERLKAGMDQLAKELRDIRVRFRKAKDPRPVERPSLKRVMPLVADACMNLCRVRGGWELSMGRLKRRFRQLKEIWEILIQEDWHLSDVFPPPPDKRQHRPRLPLRHPILAPRGMHRAAASQVVPAPG